MPNHFLGHFSAPFCSCPADTTEQPSIRNVGCLEPILYCFFYPRRHRYRPNAPRFAYQIDYGPNGPRGVENDQPSARLVPSAADRNPRAPQESHDPACPLDCRIGQLPESTGLLRGQPISPSAPQFLCTFYTANARCQIGLSNQNRQLYTPTAVPQLAAR